MTAAAMREVVLPAVRVAQDACARTLTVTLVACEPVARAAFAGVARSFRESHDGFRATDSASTFTQHAIAAGVVAGAACAAQYVTGPVLGRVIRITGALAVTGLAVSAAMHAARDLQDDLPLLPTERRALLEATSERVRDRHAGLWAAQVLTCIYNSSSRTRPELHRLGLSGALQEVMHTLGENILEGGSPVPSGTWPMFSRSRFAA